MILQRHLQLFSQIVQTQLQHRLSEAWDFKFQLERILEVESVHVLLLFLLKQQLPKLLKIVFILDKN